MKIALVFVNVILCIVAILMSVYAFKAVNDTNNKVSAIEKADSDAVNLIKRERKAVTESAKAQSDVQDKVTSRLGELSKRLDLQATQIVQAGEMVRNQKTAAVSAVSAQVVQTMPQMSVVRIAELAQAYVAEENGREAHGDFSQNPGMSLEEKRKAETNWAVKEASRRLIGAKPKSAY